MSYNQNKIIQFLFVFILIIFILSGLISKFSISSKRLLDSDQILLALFYWDVLENSNYFLRDWYIATNSLVFSDFPIHLVNGLIFGMSPFMIRIIPFITLVTGILILSLIIYRVYGSKVLLLSAAVLSCSSLFSSFFLVQLSHIGTINLSFLCLLLVILIAEDASNNGLKSFKRVVYYFLLVLVSVLGIVSDPYFIFIFSIPVIFSLIVLKFMKSLTNTKSILSLILLTVVSVAAGLVLQQTGLVGGTIVNYLKTEFASLQRIQQNFILYLQSVSELFNVNFLFNVAETLPKSMQYMLDVLNPDSLIVKISDLIVLIIVTFNAFLILKKEVNTIKKILSLYFLTLAILLSLAFIFSTQAFVIMHTRYLIALIYIFAFFFSLSIAGDHRIANPILRFLVIILFFATSAYNVYIGFHFKQEQTHLGLSRFLENNNFHYGYSDYWNSHIITGLTQNRVKVRPVKYAGGKVEPLPHLSKSDWYDPFLYRGQTFLMVPRESNKPEFGLLELTYAQIKKMFGSPESILSFENMDIYVWPYNIMEAVKKNRTMITKTTLHQIGYAESTSEGTIMHSVKGQIGFLVFGPYWPLNEGRYRVKFKLMTKGEINQEVARIDVNVMDASTNKPVVKPIEKRILSERKAEWKEYTIDFTAGKNKNKNLIYEFRVYATGTGDVKVKEILVDNLDGKS